MFTEKQKVWCAIYGAGVVTEILHASEGVHPVVVLFKDTRLAAYTSDGKYSVNGNVTLFPYPIEITKATVKPSIDWSLVSENFQYLAQDESGTCWVYEHVPILIEDEWASSRGDCTPADCLQSLVPGTCDWKESLIKRPEGDNHGG